MNGAPNALTRSGSVPSLDLKSFLPSNVEDEQVADTTHQVVMPISYVFPLLFETIIIIIKHKRRNLYILTGGILGMEAIHGELCVTLTSSCKYIYKH